MCHKSVQTCVCFCFIIKMSRLPRLVTVCDLLLIMFERFACVNQQKVASTQFNIEFIWPSAREARLELDLTIDAFFSISIYLLYWRVQKALWQLPFVCFRMDFGAFAGWSLYKKLRKHIQNNICYANATEVVVTGQLMIEPHTIHTHKKTREKNIHVN